MQRWLVSFALLAGLVALSACAAEEKATPAPAGPTPAVKPAWEQEWERVVAAAKQEGKVAVMSSASGTGPRRALTEPFTKKYGIEVEYFTASGREMVARIKTEREAGQYLWDVFIGGSSTPMVNLKPLGALDPILPALILPEVKEGKNWIGGRLDFADRDQTILTMLTYSKSPIMINTNLVKPQELKSVKDLLDAKWKGKILIGDLRGPGPGQATFSFFYAHKDLGPDFIRALARQDVQVMKDDRLAGEWLAKGTAPILVGGSDTDVEPFIREGLPIGIIDPRQLKEGGYITSGPGSISLLNKAPHPNAVKVYVNWLLSREGQDEFVKGNGYPSRRADTIKPTERWKFSAVEGYWVSYDEPAVMDIKGKVETLTKELWRD